MTADSLAKAAEEPDAAAASSVRQRKKRKWDQPAESLFYGGLAVPGCLPFEMGNLTGIGVAPFSNSVFMNSAAAVCTTASQLHNAPAMTQKTSQPKIQDELIAREIVINDADSAVRCKLTKRQTQEEIQRSTGAVVITRGKYRPPNALPDSEKPLYLHISAGAHLKDTGERIKAVDRAASMVEDIFKQSHSASLVSTSYSALNIGVQVLQPLTRCLYLGFDPDPSVNIAARMRGPNDQYINHIMNETGATVMLRGKGSGNIGIQNVGETEQPLHLFISSSNQKSLEDARILAENLLDTISVEFGAIRVPPSKVYKAVPPPPQLLDGVESSVPASPSIDTSTVKSHISSSVPVSSAASAAYISGSSLHYGVKSYGPHPTDGSSYKPLSISGGANYNGYEGMYPQAMALRQVALALRGAPVSASPAPMVVPSGTSLKSKASLGPESDKRPQKRKFQELPISSGVSQQSSGGLGVSSDGLPLSNGLSSPPSNGASPPQPPKNKLPPVPKFPQPSFTKELVPDPLMKLMEYGDDVDDGDSIGSSESAVNTESMASSAAAPTSKPFWAV